MRRPVGTIGRSQHPAPLPPAPKTARSFTIATHPDVQHRIRDELQAAGLLHTDTQPARELQYDDLVKLPYLNCTIDETMRMYPVAATASVRWGWLLGGPAGCW